MAVIAQTSAPQQVVPPAGDDPPRIQTDGVPRWKRLRETAAVLVVRWRLSSMFLWIACGAGLLACLQSGFRAHTAERESARLRSEVVRLRRELGWIHVEHRDHVYALGVVALDEMTWRWRVYLPPGEYRLYANCGRVYPQGFQPEGFIDWSIFPVDAPRTIDVSAGVRPGVDGKLQLVVLGFPRGIRIPLPSDHALQQSFQGDFGGTRVAQQAETLLTSPLCLLRFTCPAALAAAPGDGLAASSAEDGLLVWLERVPRLPGSATSGGAGAP